MWAKLKKLLEHPLYKKHREKIKFVMVGGFNTLLDLVLYAMLANMWGINPVLSSVISVGIAMCVSFYLNLTFVWRSEKTLKQTAPQFFAVTIFTGWGVQSFVIWGVTSIFGVGWLANLVAKVCATAIGMVINFLGYRFIFTGKRR